MKIFQIMVVLALVSVAHAELPPTAKSLPAINVLCFRSFVASTVKQVPGVAIDGEIEAGEKCSKSLQTHQCPHTGLWTRILMLKIP